MAGLSSILASAPLGQLAVTNHLFPLVPPWRPDWRHVRPRFRALLANLELTDAQREDGETKTAGITACLNRWYWDSSSETLNGSLVGSWGKDTRVRPPRDLDLLFAFPYSTWERINQRAGNKQSQFLQEVKDVLGQTYGQTTMRGDGQVIVIPFNTCTVEVVPAFSIPDGRFLVCDSNDGGRWKMFDPRGEERALDLADWRHAGNARKLTRALKQWRRHCNVPLKSIHIEAVVSETLTASTYSSGDEFWYDWLVRDCLAHLVSRANGTFLLPGTGETIGLGDAWLPRAQAACRHAQAACDHEYYGLDQDAGQEWQAIFGPMVPARVS